MNDLLTLLDWKSSKYGDTPENRLQLAAYWGADHVLTNGAWVPVKERAKQAAIVQTQPEGCKVVMVMNEAELRTAYDKFLKSLDLYLWLRKVSPFLKYQKERTYPVKDKELVSVTHVGSHILAKPGLIGWAIKEVKAGRDPEAIKTSAGSRGTMIHNAIFNYITAVEVDLMALDKFPEWLKSTMRHFISWSKKVELRTVEAERTVCGMEAGYAGTRDFLGYGYITLGQ